MSLHMITVVENRDTVTRLCIEREEQARATHATLRKHMVAKGWLTVTLSTVSQQPCRTDAEVARVRMLINLCASGS